MKTSQQELDLLEKLREIFPDIVGSYTVPDVRLAGKHLVTVDCFVPSLRVVVEFDGIYWHQKRKKADTRKARMLLKNSYVVVRVREETLDKRLPTIELEDSNLLIISYVSGESFDNVVLRVKDFVNSLGLSHSNDR